MQHVRFYFDFCSFSFPSSGSEANEQACRIARLYTGRHKVALYLFNTRGEECCVSCYQDTGLIMEEPLLPWVNLTFAYLTIN